MKNNASHIDNYIFSSSDNLMFDCNIWIYLYGPGGKPNGRHERTYSAALKKALVAKSTIYLDSLILSEFINRYSRIIYSMRPELSRPKDFKTFRNTADFQSVAADIARSVRRIVSLCQRTDCGFECIDISTVIDQYGKGKSDFNDLIITELCKTRSLLLVTHDNDFAQQGIRLLTANSRLLTD